MASTSFIGRAAHLARLQKFLDRALLGHGQVCFITGEPGAGKTALIAEFTRTAQQKHANVIVAFGDCNALSGEGDPYLPFREIMTLLLGDVDHGLAEGNITHENASRLRRFFDMTRDALIESGPDIVGIFVPGGSLLARLGTKLVQQDVKQTPASGDQSQVLHQYTSVLRRLAAQQPLVLVLDDLHWADSASVNLLFHIARRIEGSPIMVIGTFRPHEVAEGRGGDRHPLATVVNEVKRYYGDVEIDLDGDSDEERMSFVARILDAEPNDFAPSFHRELYRHTSGHPLFTIELINALKERGVIAKTDGRWTLRQGVEWMRLPGRVEGVIAERVGHLPEAVDELLTVASVEGEQFSVEVLAHVMGRTPMDVMRQLSEAHSKHRVVRPYGVRQEDGIRLSQFRFAHNLFQTYIYGRISEVERPYRHEAVADALERVSGERAETAAVTLGHHYAEAGNAPKAAHYLGVAGNAAMRKYAHREALDHFTRALEFASRMSPPDSALVAQLNESIGDVLLQGAHGEEAIQRYQRILPTATSSLMSARLNRKIAKAYVDRHMLEEARAVFENARQHLDAAPQNDEWWQEWVSLTLSLAWFYYFANSTELQQLIENSQSQMERVADATQRASYLNVYVMAGLRREHYFLSDETVAATRRFLEAARETRDLQQEALAEFQLGFCLLWSSQRADAEPFLRSAVEKCERVGNGLFGLLSLTYLTIAVRLRGDVDETALLADASEAAARTAANNSYVAAALANRGWALYKRGDFDTPPRLFAETMQVWRKVKIAYPFFWLALAPWAKIAFQRGDIAEAQRLIGEIIAPGQQRLPDDLYATLAQAAREGNTSAITDALAAAEQHQML